MGGKYIKNQSGLTLIELLAGVTIFSIVVSVLWGAFHLSMKQSDFTRSHIDLRQEANLIISKLRQAHQGDNYTLCYENGNVYFDAGKTNSLASPGVKIEGIDRPDSNENILFRNGVGDDLVIKESINVPCAHSIEVNTFEPLFVTIVLVDEKENKFEIDTTIQQRLVAVSPQEIDTGEPTQPNIPEPNEPSEPSNPTNPGIITGYVFINGTGFEFKGHNLYGNGATIFIDGNLQQNQIQGDANIDVSNIYINGTMSLGGGVSIGKRDNSGNIVVNRDVVLEGNSKIYGNVYVNRKLTVKSVTINGNIYVNGDVVVGWTPTFKNNARVYYTGNINFPEGMGAREKSNYIKVNSVEIPEFPRYEIPSLRPDHWYAQNGYSKTVKANNTRLFDNNVTIRGFSDGNRISNAVIVSKGDIIIEDGDLTLTGILYAPNGTVRFKGEAFKGIVISKNGFYVTQGNTDVESKPITDFISNPEQYPFQ